MGTLLGINKRYDEPERLSAGNLSKRPFSYSAYLAWDLRHIRQRQQSPFVILLQSS